jgi:hypothetical protein
VETRVNRRAFLRSLFAAAAFATGLARTKLEVVNESPGHWLGDLDGLIYIGPAPPGAIGNRVYYVSAKGLVGVPDYKLMMETKRITAKDFYEPVGS